MTIGIDGNEANVTERVGVSWYTHHILEELKASKHRVYVYLRTPPLPTMPPENDQYSYRVVPAQRLWSQVALPLALWKKRDLDVFIAPAHYAPRFCPCPTVVVVHDVSYRYFPRYFTKKDIYQLKSWTAYSVRAAAQVVAVSHTTARDVEAEYNRTAVVIYNGYQQKRIPQEPRIPGSLLYIGTVQPRKNIEVVARALLYNPALTLTIIGKKGWFADETLSVISSLHCDKRIDIRQYVTEEEKEKALASHAALVIPGLYEGFGLPILEAFNASLPVIASPTGALPEVGGDACLYADPYDPKAWAEAYGTITSEMVQKGHERLALFSWKKTGAELCAVCERLQR